MNEFILAQSCEIKKREEITGDLHTVILLFKQLRKMDDRRMVFLDFDAIIPSDVSLAMGVWNFSFSVFFKGNRVVIYKVIGGCIKRGNVKYPYRYELYKDVYNEQLEKDFLFYAKLMS